MKEAQRDYLKVEMISVKADRSLAKGIEVMNMSRCFRSTRLRSGTTLRLSNSSNCILNVCKTNWTTMRS